MSDTVIVAIVSVLFVAIPAVIATIFSNNKSAALMQYRINELDHKVEKHNQVVERMALAERELKAIWRNLDDKKEREDKES